MRKIRLRALSTKIWLSGAVSAAEESLLGTKKSIKSQAAFNRKEIWRLHRKSLNLTCMHHKRTHLWQIHQFTTDLSTTCLPSMPSLTRTRSRRWKWQWQERHKTPSLKANWARVLRTRRKSWSLCRSSLKRWRSEEKTQMRILRSWKLRLNSRSLNSTKKILSRRKKMISEPYSQ